MKKPKFTIRTLIWLMIAVAAFFAGRESMRPLREELEELRGVKSRLIEADVELEVTKVKLAAEIAKREALEADE